MIAHMSRGPNIVRLFHYTLSFAFGLCPAFLLSHCYDQSVLCACACAVRTLSDLLFSCRTPSTTSVTYKRPLVKKKHWGRYGGATEAAGRP